MKSHFLYSYIKYLHARSYVWTDAEWAVEVERRAAFERQLKAEGYKLHYINEMHEVDVFINFVDDAQAAIFKLTYM